MNEHLRASILVEKAEIELSTWITDYEPKEVASVLIISTGRASFHVSIEPWQCHELKAAIDQHLDNLCVKTKELEQLQFAEKQEVLPL
ncbi:hypothetical protein LG200_05185 [Methylobacillus caricis]|uniref:hypothetical protein n=1 Tax=Methylobacillus caricis TaxID=1971611 RepID=UPI001CFFA0E7|nr:hypothetical protein [Methylobacillus caricis]MCB5187398.1 hypothetical protein [Methylobacillus caricis]